MKFFLGLFLALLISSAYSQQNVFLMDFDEMGTKCFSDYDDFNYPRKVDLSVLNLVCHMVLDLGYTYYHHSDYRFKSQHWVGKALDFHLGDMIGKSQREKLKMLKMQIKEMRSWLQSNNHGYDDKIGWGIYPSWNSPGHHWDTRGKKARWSFINGKQRSFRQGLNWIKLEYGLE